MIPIKILGIINDLKDQINTGDREKAIQTLDNICQTLNNIIETMGDAEKMTLLGVIALRYREADVTSKEIPILEQLCQIALADLQRRGIMVSSDDIGQTATDLLLLGVAYCKVHRKIESQESLTKAQELYAEIDWEMSVDDILGGKKEVYIGPKGGKSKVLKQVRDSVKGYRRPALLSFNFKGGAGKCHVYFP